MPSNTGSQKCRRNKARAIILNLGSKFQKKPRMVLTRPTEFSILRKAAWLGSFVPPAAIALTQTQPHKMVA